MKKPMIGKRLRLCVAALVFVCFFALGWTVSAQAESARKKPSQSDFGGVGLLQIPNARFGDDGEFTISTGYVSPYRRHTVSLQALPWLEGVFRYTSIGGRDYSAARDNQNFKDRGMDVKFRLLEEGEYAPQIALALRDIGGTQIFSSEYIVASKRFYNFDTTFGLAWGNAGTRGDIKNPFYTIFGESFSKESKSKWGTFSNNFFKGEKASLIGGVEYVTPWDNLRLKVEYEGNDYSREFTAKAKKSDTAFNYGVQYSPYDWVDATAGIERGDTMLLRVNLRSNFHKFKGIPKVDEKPAQDFTPRANKIVSSFKVAQLPVLPRASMVEKLPTENAVDVFFNTLEAEGFMVEGVEFNSDTIIAKLRPALKDKEPPNTGKLARLALAAMNAGLTNVPAKKMVFSLKDESGNITKATFNRNEMEKSLALTGSPAALIAPLPEPFVLALKESRSEEIKLAENNANQDAAALIFLAAEQEGVEIESTNIESNKVEVKIARVNRKITNSSLARIALATGRAMGGEEVSEVVFSWRSKGKKVKKSFPAMPQYASLNGGEAIPLHSKKSIKQIAKKVFAGLEAINFVGESFDIKGDTAILHYSQGLFSNPAKAAGRAARVVAANAPDEVEQIKLVVMKNGTPLSSITIWRRDLEDYAQGHGSAEEIWHNAKVENGEKAKGKTVAYNKEVYPDFSFGLEPQIRQHVGGGDNFYFWQIYGVARSDLKITNALNVEGSMGFNILNNFDKMEQGRSDSKLEHVRSDTPLYIRESNVWLNSLSSSYVTKLAPNLYGRLSLGLFEMMFGGVSGEVLYRPVDENWAIGLDLNRVRQREITGDFRFREFRTTTGHLTYYHQLPLYGVDVALSYGRYLAQDWGSTLEISRNFDSGIKVGVFATKTNVSAERFGEGSFDKGIFINIPLDLFTTRSTTGKAGLLWRPLTRDGGQKLGMPKPLYDLTENSTKKEFEKGVNELMD